MVLMENLRLLLYVWMQVHPRGNAVFLWDWLLHSKAWAQQHLIRHLYVCPPFFYPPLHHFLLLQSPTLHCASGKNTSARCNINNKDEIPCLSLVEKIFFFPFFTFIPSTGRLAASQSRVSGDVRDLMAQGHLQIIANMAAYSQVLQLERSLPAPWVILMPSLIIVWLHW